MATLMYTYLSLKLLLLLSSSVKVVNKALYFLPFISGATILAPRTLAALTL